MAVAQPLARRKTCSRSGPWRRWHQSSPKPQAGARLRRGFDRSDLM